MWALNSRKQLFETFSGQNIVFGLMNWGRSFCCFVIRRSGLCNRLCNNALQVFLIFLSAADQHVNAGFLSATKAHFPLEHWSNSWGITGLPYKNLHKYLRFVIMFYVSLVFWNMILFSMKIFWNQDVLYFDMYINFPEHYAYIIGFSGFQLKGKNRVSDKSHLYGGGIIS